MVPEKGLRRCSRGDRAGGYNLVVLMVIVAVINIGIAASLPLWSKVIQRQKEDELVFRGLQYAEAIRVFQIRTGRFPTRLEELIEIEPRCIRQLWLDPMNEEPEWGLILAQGVPGTQIQPGAAPDRRNRRRESRRERNERRQRESGLSFGRDSEETISPRQRIENPGGGRRGVPRAGQQVTLGPITGVHSLSEEAGARSFQGGSTYSDWKFTTEILPQIQLGATGENIPRLHSNWIGRAFPEGAESGLEGGLPESPLDRSNDDRSRSQRKRSRSSDRE